jgi:hypothetical protein
MYQRQAGEKRRFQAQTGGREITALTAKKWSAFETPALRSDFLSAGTVK